MPSAPLVSSQARSSLSHLFAPRLLSSSSILALSYHPTLNPLREGNLGGENGILTAVTEAPGPANDAPASTLVLAEKRTKRPDILDNFCQYQGAAGFILSVLWFVSFGMALVIGLGWIEAAMIAGAREAGVSPIVGSFPRKEAALVEYQVQVHKELLSYMTLSCPS
ncbi:hypothetical protein LguiA_001654 [Lonicera macranthoides]